jgi:hypothetical protein
MIIPARRLACLLHRNIIIIAAAPACARADGRMHSNIKESISYNVSSFSTAAFRQFRQAFCIHI